jgi:hypothetical protein
MALPASSSMDTRDYFHWGVNRWGMKLTTYVYLVLRLRMIGAVLPLLWVFIACSGTALLLIFILSPLCINCPRSDIVDYSYFLSEEKAFTCLLQYKFYTYGRQGLG